LLAVGWFSLMTVLAAVRAFGVQRISLIGLIVGALCVPAILYLDYIQLAIIHAICSDCELAHALGVIVFVLFIVIYRADRKTKET